MAGTIKAYRTALLTTAAEAVYGVQIADGSLTQWVEVNEFEPGKTEKTYRTDAGRIKGVRGITQRQLESAMGTMPRQMDASVEVITWLLALGLTNVASAGTVDPWTHTIKHPPVCTLVPKSTSLVEGIVCSGLTAGYKLFKGCVIEQLSIEMDGKGAVKLGWTWKTDGSETTKGSFTFPTSTLALTYLLGSMLTLELHPNGGGSIDITSLLNSFKITLNFNVQPRKTSSSSVFVSGYRYGGDAPTVDIEFQVSADKSHAIYGYHENDTLLTLVATFDANVTPARSVVCSVSNCHINAEEDADDIEPVLNCKVSPLDIAANTGPAVWTCKTGVAAYLTPLP
ncbi:MAG: hypothetical protein L0229_22570 [Blastocatellia bacterium]|nr:hypothetical protein [Blastocatellia bacterium]